MRIKLLYFFCYQASFLLWCYKLHQHYFEFTNADRVALVLAALLPLLLLKAERSFKGRFIWLVPVLFPVGLLPVIHYSLALFSDVWILFYLALIAGGSLLLITKANHFTLAGIGSALMVWLLPFDFQPNQVKYYDRLTKTISTRKGEVDIVTWKDERWIYYNNSLVISTVDGHIHSETLVHTTLPFYEDPNVLLLGDDFGLTLAELKKYPCTITHLPLDDELFSILREESAPINRPAHGILSYMKGTQQRFDIIIIDLPDPEHIAFQHFYEETFYSICNRVLSENGLLITNAGSYYTTSKYYQTIVQYLEQQHLETTVLQALVPTLGHRAWVLGSRHKLDMSENQVPVKTTWFNEDALQLMLAKGKESYPF